MVRGIENTRTWYSLVGKRSISMQDIRQGDCAEPHPCAQEPIASDFDGRLRIMVRIWRHGRRWVLSWGLNWATWAFDTDTH